MNSNFMKPTNKLRFVMRVISTSKTENGITIGNNVRILQQWWEESMTINLGWTGEIPTGQAKGEWRDVPTEET